MLIAFSFLLRLLDVIYEVMRVQYACIQNSILFHVLIILLRYSTSCHAVQCNKLSNLLFFVQILGLKEVSTRTSSGATFEQWNDDPRPDKDTLEGLVWSCSTHHDASYTSEGLVETKCCRLNQQVMFNDLIFI